MTFLDVCGAANAAGVSTSGGGVVPYGVALVGFRLHPVVPAGFQLRVCFNALIGNGLGLQNPDPSEARGHPLAVPEPRRVVLSGVDCVSRVPL